MNKSLLGKVWILNRKLKEDGFSSLPVVDSMEKVPRRKNDLEFKNLPIPDMDEMIDLILQFSISGLKFLIYGDYDVDGVTSSAIISRTFNKMGIEHQVFIPSRFEGGYGLNSKDVLKYDFDVLLCLDCGTNNVEEVEEIKKQRECEVLIIDHHNPKDILPDALIVNPKVFNLHPETLHLSTSGIAFKIAIKMLIELGISFEELIVLASLGLVCDVTDLTGENWQIVKMAQGFRGFNLGIDIMAEELKIFNFSTYTQGFIIGPRLNASGRMESATVSYEFLTTEDKAKARDLFLQLEQYNQQRKKDVEIAEAEAMKNSDNTLPFIFYGSSRISRGVAGLVASRLLEKTGKPCFIYEESEGMAIGSIRSRTVNLSDIMKQLSPLLISGGGHNYAAGFKFKLHNKEKIIEFLKGSIHTEETFQNLLEIDFKLKDSSLLSQIFDTFAPFGPQNESFKILVSPDNMEVQNSTSRNGRSYQIIKTPDYEVLNFSDALLDTQKKYDMVVEILGDGSQKPKGRLVDARERD